MRRASPPLHVLATAAATEANSAIIAPNMPLRGRGRGFSRRPYSSGRGQFVTGDDHFQSVRDVNLGFRRGESESFANQSRYQYPPYNPRRPPPYHQNPQFRQPRRCQSQQFRLRPPDYRDWEYAATQPPPDCERFIILSYNILADYLAIDHRGKLYFHIPRHMLDWQWRKKNLVFELGLWSADIMCLQEVDRFHDLVEEFKFKGYSGIWKMRTGNAVDGCAIFWRTSRFKLRHQESIEFSKLGLRDNVAQICVLELMNQNGSLPSSLTGSNKVVICNIHVLYNPNRGEIKLGQVRVLLERAKAVSEIWNDAPVVICGDFNCTPKSPLYNFISEQKLNLSGIDRDKVSGQASAVIHQARLYGPNSSEGSANGSAQVTSIAHKKEVSVQQNNYSDMQKPDNQDNGAENQYTHTVLDITDKSWTDVQCEKGSGALYNAGKVTQQSAVDNSKIISQVDSIKESIASYSEGRFPVDHINNEIHDNTPRTSLSLEAAHTNAVSPLNPESSSENFDFDLPKENIHTEFDSCPTSLGEDNQSFRVEIDPKPTDLLNVEVSSAKSSTQTSGSDSFTTHHAAYRESPSFELISDDQMNCSSTSYQVDKSHQSTTIDFPLDETLEKLSHDMFDKATIRSENIGEDDDAFISALHNVEEGFHPENGPDLEKSDQFEELKSASDELPLHAQSDEVEDDLPLSLNSQSFDAERTTYNPSLWTPMEIKTATGNSECTFLEHSLPLKSTYTEVRNCSGTRDPNGEPLVTSYNRCFLGTVDYIWRSEGFQTIRVLAPIPKDAMQWTPGFPTKKWGSDHIALVSELAFAKGVTNISRDVQ